MSKKLYAYGNGSFGCLYDHTDGPFDTQEAAANAAADLFELQDAGREALVRDAHLNLHEYNHVFIDMDVELRGGQGADVIEVFEVDEDWTCE